MGAVLATLGSAACLCVPRKKVLQARHRTKSGTSVRDYLFMRTGSGRFETANEDDLSLFERMWRQADKDGSGTLSKVEIRRLLLKFNLPPISDKKFNAMFNDLDADRSGDLSREEFGRLFYSLQSLPDVSELFEKYAKGDKLTSEELTRLLLEVNGDELAPEKLHALIVKFEMLSLEATLVTSPASTPSNLFLTLSKRGLALMLADPSNCVMKNRPSNDLSQPLSHYFINSSHNTYITGNQFSSTASADAVRSALLDGVRVVELDVFDSGANVVVSHKNSLVSTAPFDECVRAIAAKGFSNSDMPIILTLENHCSAEGQRRLVDVLHRELGPVLYMHDWESDKYATANEDEDSVEDAGDDEDGDGPTERSAPSSSAVGSGSGDHDQGPDVWLSPADLRGKVVLRDKAKGRVPELARLCYIKNTALGAKADPKQAGLNFPKRHWATSSSVEEGKINSKLAVDGSLHSLIRYTCDHLVRSYPAGMRVDSTNYNPEQYWAAGLQIVALNMQTHDDPVIMNRGMFRDSPGYVLKPAYMLHPDDPDLKPHPLKLRVTVVSGHNIPKPEYRSDSSEVIDPYVVISCEGTMYQTPVVIDNGFDPKWDCSFDFDVHNPELALILFKVMDSEMVGILLGKDDFCAAYACPVSMLRNGYRMVPLEYANGRILLHAYLYVRVQVLNASHKLFSMV